MIIHWSSLIPPLLVLALVILTNRIILALLAGIISAAMIATHGSFLDASGLVWNVFIRKITDIDTLYLYGFLIILGSLIALFSHTGATTDFAHHVTKKITSRSAAEFACIFLSGCLAIDDYLNIPTTGRIMNPLADRLGVSRLKIAFLIHAFAGPLVLMIPLSSWAAIVVTYIDQAGVNLTAHASTRISADPFFVYLLSLPFMLYSLCLFISIFFIIKYRFSFGPMQADEMQHQAPPIQDASSEHADGRGLIIPLAVLLISIFAGLAYTGGYVRRECGFFEAIKQNKDPFLVMLVAASLALISGLIISMIQKKFRLVELPSLIKEGYLIMYSGIVLVFLATILSVLLADYVGTGQYLATLLLGTMPLFLIPIMLFVVSFICTSTTGSAWGTFALLIPITIPLLTSLSGVILPTTPGCIPLLFPALGALFSGAVCGNHISPLADTTMLAAISTQTDPMRHAVTQAPYALPAVIGSLLGFLVAGILATQTTFDILAISGISIGISMLVCLITLFFLNRMLRAH